MKTLKLTVIAFFLTVASVKAQDVQPILQQYYNLKDALVKSDAKLSVKEAQKMLSVTEKSTFSKDSEKEMVKKIEASLKDISGSSSLDIQRKAFKPLSENLQALLAYSGNKGATVYVQYCPMALKYQGGSWLSPHKEIRNPYYGDKMLKCGKVQEEL